MVFVGKIGPVQILHDAFFHARRRAGRGRNGGKGAVGIVSMRVERRDVDALELRRLAQKFLLAQTLPLGCAVAFDDLAGALLPFADGEKVDEIGQRLRVYRADAPGEDNALQPLAVFGQQRQSGKLKHVEHVRVAHLVAEREGNKVKIADGIVALQRPEGQPVRAHLRLHIAPGGEHPLAPDAGHLVHHAVEDAHADVRHADLIRVREAERHAEIDFTFIFLNFAVLTAGVPGGLLYERENSFKFLVHTSKLLHRVCVKCMYIL